MKMRDKIIFLLMMVAASADASTTTSRQLDSIKNSTGGASLSVPSTGTTFDTDTNTLTLTNKTLSSTTDVLGGVTMTLGSDGTGDIYYRSSGGVLTRLAIGSTSQVLTVSGGLPSWAAASGGGTWVQEDEASCNGSTTAYTLGNTPTSSGVVSLYLDGTIQRQGSGKDYTISGASITLAVACATGQKLYAVYTH
jgi:hypothetical protein